MRARRESDGVDARRCVVRIESPAARHPGARADCGACWVAAGPTRPPPRERLASPAAVPLLALSRKGRRSPRAGTLRRRHPHKRSQQSAAGSARGASPRMKGFSMWCWRPLGAFRLLCRVAARAADVAWVFCAHCCRRGDPSRAYDGKHTARGPRARRLRVELLLPPQRRGGEAASAGDTQMDCERLQVEHSRPYFDSD